MRDNKPNGCSCRRQRSGVLCGKKNGTASGLWILTSALCSQFLIQRIIGCGYRKSSTFGGGGDDIERNPIASGASIGRGGGGCCRWLEINKRRRNASDFERPFSPSACHLSISVGRCGSVTWRLCEDHQASCARAAPIRSPLATARARSTGSLKLVRGFSVLPDWVISRLAEMGFL